MAALRCFRHAAKEAGACLVGETSHAPLLAGRFRHREPKFPPANLTANSMPQRRRRHGKLALSRRHAQHKRNSPKLPPPAFREFAEFDAVFAPLAAPNEGRQGRLVGHFPIAHLVRLVYAGLCSASLTFETLLTASIGKLRVRLCVNGVFATLGCSRNTSESLVKGRHPRSPARSSRSRALVCFAPCERSYASYAC